ncbi:MAG: bifunctional 4-hydroxy-2-oxoglutarate aldolase/2-dehydro-3-deoxy-phosphogluconate aldolase [Clostridia bacterium]|nr:bifunctional 4-hydroxy-2-oxoglutarate aldolase/2-dehydro-3-deoxy-phosphogluconate aldolase [Clostridia bacterium]
MDMLKQLSLAGLVPVIKVKKAEDAVPLCRALKNGGLPVAEITFRTDAAEEAIRLVHEALPEVLLGAGTVLTCEQADRAWNAGAGYIVAPGLNPVVVKHCIDKGYPVLPGCANPSDIEAALSFGLKTVKFFPAEALGGLKLIKAMAAPYGDVKFVPTGGINEKNLPEYLAFPKIAACGGSWMVPDDAIEAKDWDKIERLAREAVNVMLGLHVKHIGVNNQDAETAVAEAKKLSALLGWPMQKESEKGLFVGESFEMMKTWFRGTHGHIAIGTKNVDRAKWHMEQRGFAFDEETATFTPDGRMKFIYLKDEIAGFAIHLMMA